MITKISGERFSVVYRLLGDKEEAYRKAVDICYEQTVEFPAELVPAGMIKDEIVGRIVSFKVAERNESNKGNGSGGRRNATAETDTGSAFEAVISYAVETSAGELTQLLNVIFGNISIKPGIRVERLELPDSLLKQYQGPRFGRAGLREWTGVKDRPLLFTALKPMGLSSRELADMAYKCALGGIDIIKDDHGLTDQIFAPFSERVALCVEAVERANRETGEQSIYVPNITAPAHLIRDRAREAKGMGAKGVLLAPALSGFDIMRHLAEDQEFGLPIFSHPAFLGSYVTSKDNGISHFALFGQLNRLAGADAVIYPNYGGRFSFSREECAEIVQGTLTDMGRIKPIFPSPGGGMSLDRIEELGQVYGKDVLFLVGGGLFKQGPDLVENCRYFRQMVTIETRGQAPCLVRDKPDKVPVPLSE
jgi:ribulose-bisphosphate carboxylase large chain